MGRFHGQCMVCYRPPPSSPGVAGIDGNAGNAMTPFGRRSGCDRQTGMGKEDGSGVWCGEKGRWGALAEQLEAFYITLTGDVLTSAGMIAYAGAFTQAFRIEIVKEWVAKCVEKSIPSS